MKDIKYWLLSQTAIYLSFGLYRQQEEFDLCDS